MRDRRLINYKYKITRLKFPKVGAGTDYFIMDDNNYIVVSDGIIETNVKLLDTITDGSVGFSFRSNGLTYPNLQRYESYLKSDGIYLYKRPNDAVQIGVYNFTPEIGREYNIRCVFIGSSIKVYLDGILRIDVTNTEFTTGYVSLNLYNAACTYRGKEAGLIIDKIK